MLQWYFILFYFFSPDHILTMLHLAPIFFLRGSWVFLGGSFYPSNTLDRTLISLLLFGPTEQLEAFPYPEPF